MIFRDKAMKTLLMLLAASSCITTPTWGSVQKTFVNNIAFHEPRNTRSVDDELILRLSKMELEDFIKYFGYPCDAHEVTTEDGYILTMHHVAHGRKGSTGENRPAIFFQHGLTSYSGHWFSAGPEKSPGFIFADNGYDVWVGNARGNQYSRHHTTLDPDSDNSFWNFSWHEMGVYDLPASIDYILKYTNEKKLFYVGHSQGTTSYYVMLSMRPEYNRKIKASFTLAPVAYMSHMNLPMISLMKPLAKYIEMAADLSHLLEISNDLPFVKFFARDVCTTSGVNEICVNGVFLGTGFNPNQFNYSLIPIITANFPSGASVKQFMHYLQEIRSGQFQRFDYDKNNELYYGSLYPPKYNVKNIKAPTHLLYSRNDYLSSAIDVKRLYKEMPKGNKHKYLIKDPMWNHNDYIVGIDAKEFVYDYILKTLKKQLSRENRKI